MMVHTSTSASHIRSQMADTVRRHSLGIDTKDAGIVGISFDSMNVVAENGGHEIEGMATTDDVDCDDEVILQDGLDWSVFNRYKAIYMDHAYGTRNVVGSLRWMRRSGNGWKMRARLMNTSLFEDAARVMELAQMGVLGFSVGVIPVDRGSPTDAERKRWPKATSIIRKASVFEVSATPMPCNLACAGVSVVADGAKAHRLVDLVAKGMKWVEMIGNAYRPKGKTIVILD
jgi:hypothetical protein